MNNFDFLKPIDKDLYEIVLDAERLYRDEYFEQCIAQTRRFGENICKLVLANSITTERTFDDMLATLKDRACNSEQEKEFVDDLYFLKREGNNCVHSSKVKKDGIVALECLQRAFELAINYAVYNRKADSRILKYRYDTELLITGKKSKGSLAEKYEQEKEKNNKKSSKKKTLKQSHTTKMPKTKKERFSLFKYFLVFSLFVSSILILIIFLLSII